MRTNFFAACMAALLASSSSGLDLSALAASPETVLNVDPALEPLILAATDTEVNKKTNDKYHERSRQMALKPQPDFKKLEAGATPFNDDNFKLDEAYIWAAAEEGTERQNEMVATFGEKDEAGNKKNWKRISQFDDFKKLHLFKGRDAAGKQAHISVNDPRQGSIGDCWLVTSMSALADQQPKRIADMFKNSKKAASGIYAVDLYNLGVPRTVVVDDYLAFRPRYTVGSQPRVKLNEKELDKDEYPQTHIWPPILEKAVAKMLGNYFHIEGGSTGQGLGLLTGAPYVKHLHPDVVKAGKGKGGTEDLWKDIVRYLKAGHFVTTGTSGHAYSVLSAQEVGGKRYMVVRNPWGHEDKETFGYKDDALAKQLGKAKLEDYELNVNDGQFVMDWETEYLVKFVDTYLSLDTTLWAYDSFLRLDDKTKSSERPGIREGICGKKCLRYEFTLSSTKDQNVYVNMWVWPKAAYIRHPPAKPKGPSIIDYDDKQVVFLEYITGNTINIAQVNVQTGATAMKEPLKMKAGESTKIAIEFDAEGSSNFKDWSVTAWGDEGGDSIKVTPNDKSLKSDKWPEIK